MPTNATFLGAKAQFALSPVSNLTFTRPVPPMNPAPPATPVSSVAPIPPPLSPAQPQLPASYELFKHRLVAGAAAAFKAFLTADQLKKLREGFPIALSSISPPGDAGDAGDAGSRGDLEVHHVRWNSIHKFFRGRHHMPEHILRLLSDPHIGLSIVLCDGERVGAILYTREDAGQTAVVRELLGDDRELLADAFKKHPPAHVRIISFRA